MRITKPLLAVVLSTGLLFGVTACGTTAAPKPSPSATSTAATVAQQKLIAQTYKDFLDGVFGMSTATATKLTDLYSNVDSTNYKKLSDSGAQSLIDQTLTLVPSLKNVDVSSYSPQEQVAVYATVLSIGIYSVDSKTTVAVDATKVKVAKDGVTASMPYTALQVSINGTAATQSASQSTETVPFLKKAGKWYVDGKSVIGDLSAQ